MKEAAFISYVNGKITKAEMYKYQELHNKLMGTDIFVEVGDTPEWEEFQKLTNKITSI